MGQNSANTVPVHLEDDLHQLGGTRKVTTQNELVNNLMSSFILEISFIILSLRPDTLYFFLGNKHTVSSLHPA